MPSLSLNNPVLQGYVERLNDEQRRAVLLPATSSLILSTAGSGKTSTLTCRIAYLLSEMGAAPQEILAVTFTNKAAGEMKHRLKSFAITAMPSWIGTFHGICNRMLRSHAPKVGLRKDFYIMDSGEQESTIKKIIKLNYSKDLDATNIIHQINSWQEQGLRPHDITQKSLTRDIFKDYEAVCLKNNCVDFGQLISRVYEILNTHEDVALYYWSQFKYILVDEFQDTNDLQYKWLKKLSMTANPEKAFKFAGSAASGVKPNTSIPGAHHNVPSGLKDAFEEYLERDKPIEEAHSVNVATVSTPVPTSAVRSDKNVLFVVGDDDQSLYSWRGARVQNMDDFISDYQPAIIKLEKNYRSDGYILQAANAVIQNNKIRQQKELVATFDSVEKIRYYKAENDLVEAGFLAEQIMNYRRSGYKFAQMAILYRTNAQSRSIEKIFTAQNIPFLIYGGFKFFERAEVKNAMAYFRLGLNPHDNLAFSRVYNVPARSLGATSFEKLQQCSQQYNLSLFDAIDKLDAKTKEKFEVFKELVEAVNMSMKGASTKGLAKQMTACIVASNLEVFYKNDKKDGVQKLENLYELISAASVFERENANVPKTTMAQEFIALASLDADPETKKKDPAADAVKIMTIHTSKGLEWDIVFMSGVEEGLLPHASNSLDEEKLAEERRLMYVAMTRARKILYITRAQERMFAGSTYMSEASRFLYEIPKNLIVSKF